MTYQPRRAPAKWFDGAPDIVRRNVAVIHAIRPAAPLDYDVLFTGPHAGDNQAIGLDFSARGEWGCHFFLEPWECRAWRERNRRKRVAWRDLPAVVQRSIVCYLEVDL